MIAATALLDRSGPPAFPSLGCAADLQGSSPASRTTEGEHDRSGLPNTVHATYMLCLTRSRYEGSKRRQNAPQHHW